MKQMDKGVEEYFFAEEVDNISDYDWGYTAEHFVISEINDPIYQLQIVTISHNS